ncbi:MAG: hypothetical protein J5689_03075 [Clostridia bacterium]|nr:hypothetical protein [Clostridia bacterium]
MKDELDLTQKPNLDRIIKHGDDIRKGILEATEVDINQTSPNVFNYKLKTNDVGLNLIGGVDMGYTLTTVDNNGINFGKKNPYLRELEYNVELMKACENSVVILNGGLFSFIPKTQNGNMLSYENQIAYFYSLFKDLAKDGKIVAMVRGTDEHRILKNHQIDVLDILQNALGLKGKVCNDALINTEIQDELLGPTNVGIRTINWQNTAITASYVGRKMEERATKRAGADIYVAQTCMNYFQSSVVGENVNGKKINKPIYLISSGGYAPFKGSVAAGAEYNSIRDGDLAPSSFWYRVTVEKNKNASEGERPYVVYVNPISYIAHQVNYRGADIVTAKIENRIIESSDDIMERILEEYRNYLSETREKGREKIRDVLIENGRIDRHNKLVRQFKEEKKKAGEEVEYEQPVTDLGSNLSGDKTVPIPKLGNFGAFEEALEEAMSRKVPPVVDVYATEASKVVIDQPITQNEQPQQPQEQPEEEMGK